MRSWASALISMYWAIVSHVTPALTVDQIQNSPSAPSLADRNFVHATSDLRSSKGNCGDQVSAACIESFLHDLADIIIKRARQR